MAKDVYEIEEQKLYAEYVNKHRMMFSITEGDMASEQGVIHVDEITSVLKANCEAHGVDFKNDVVFLNKDKQEHQQDFYIIKYYAPKEKIDYVVKLKTEPSIYYVVLIEGADL